MATLGSHWHLPVSVLLAVLIPVCQSQTGVCYAQTNQRQSYLTYYRTTYSVSYSCGVFNLGRCYRTRYRQLTSTRYRTVYMSSFACCAGYQRVGSSLSCEPICIDCDTNHRCTRPYNCVCPIGWAGPDCQTDVNECNRTELCEQTYVDDCSQIDFCEQSCNNTIGSYSCSCDSDFNLATDLHSCLGMPENITFDPISSRTMTLSWDPPVADSRDGTILSYSIFCSSDDHTEFSLRQIIIVPAQSVPMTSLNPFTNYNCCIATQTTKGNGPYHCDSDITSEDAPEDPPSNVSVTNTSAYSLFIEWDPPNTPNGILVNYTIYLDYNNGTTDVRVADFNAMAYLLEGLSPHQLVGVEITANTSVGEGPRSPIQEIRTHQAVPTPVTALDAGGVSNTSLKITWGLPDVLNGILIYYDVNVSSSSIGYFEAWRVQSHDPLQLNITDLEPYVPYTIEISAATHAGEGDVNTIIQFTKEGIPDVPTIVNVNRVSATEIQLIWNQLTLEESRGFPVSYTVAYSGTERATCPEVDPEPNTVIVTHSGNSQLVISNLDPRLEYCVAIAASTATGTSGFSDAQTVPLYSNSLFQLRFSGFHNCIDWVHENSPEKVMDIMNVLVLQLIDTCNCDFSMEYVTDPSLTCEITGDNVAIFRARIISTAEKRSTEFLQLLQAWASDAPLVIVNQVHLRLEMECSVQLNEIGETECIPSDNSTMPPGVDSTGLQNVTMTPQPSPVSLPVIIISAVCGLLALIVLITIIISIYGCIYTKRKTKTKIRKTDSYRYQDTRLTVVKENPVAGVNVVNLYDKDPTDDDLEEPPMDYGETTSTTDEKTPIN